MLCYVVSCYVMVCVYEKIINWTKCSIFRLAMFDYQRVCAMVELHRIVMGPFCGKISSLPQARGYTRY